ncbi:MAG: hypothetical protein R2726_04575 [Acidimicrobiales bacterium]
MPRRPAAPWLLEQRAWLRFSPPRHVHHLEDTALYVVDGAITVVVEDELCTVSPVARVFCDVPHTFRRQ